MEEKVFRQDLLREIIINYAIHTKRGTNVCRRTLRSLRLVRKSWLQTTTKLLQRCKKPLYVLTLNKANSLDGSSLVQQEGKILDQLKNRIMMPSSIDKNIPTFSIKVLEEFFRHQNHESLSNCLTICGRGLVQMEIFMPANGGSLIGMFPPFSLPHLRKLTVHWSRTRLEGLDEGEAIAKSSYNASYLVHSILNGASSLKELILPFSWTDTLLPSGFEFVMLPKSLKILNIARTLRKGSDLDFLVRKPIPNLSSLKLMMTSVVMEDGVLLRVLENVSCSLKEFAITAVKYQGPPRMVTYLRFPVMKRLTHLRMGAIHCEFKPDMLPLESCLPKLRKLMFMNQTSANFQKLTENSKFKFFDFLGLELVNESCHERGNKINYVQSLGTGEMESVHRSFPNLRSLTLKMTARKICGLKYVFSKMTKLETINIVIVGGDGSDFKPDCWDSLFIGVTEDCIAGLRETPTRFLDPLQNSDLPSIKMLTELTTLGLATDWSPTSDGHSPSTMISDLTFQFALMKMPKLCTLKFYERFMASDSMTKKWKDMGRSLIYSPFKRP